MYYRLIPHRQICVKSLDLCVICVGLSHTHQYILVTYVLVHVCMYV